MHHSPCSFISLPFCILLSLTLSPSLASSCQVFEPALSPATSQICSAFVNQEISPLNQSFVDEQLSGSDLFNFVENVKGVITLECYKILAGIMCQSAYPTCTTMDGESISVSYPCESLCIAATVACNSAMALIGDIPLDCSQFASDNGSCSTDYFPPTPVSSLFILTVTAEDCPQSVYALRKNPKDEGARCALKCPDPEFSISQIETIAKLDLAVALLGIFLIVFCLFSYLIDVKKRQFPARLQIFLCLSLLLALVGAAMSGLHPQHSVMCMDHTTYSDARNNHLCAVQGALMLYFGYTGALWILPVCGVAFLTVVCSVNLNTLKRFEIHFHAFIWGIALILLIIVLRYDLITYSTTSRLYCFLAVDETDRDLYYFYIPLTVIVSFDILLFIGVAVKIRMVGWSAADEHVKSALERVLLITFFFIVVLALTSISRFAENSEVMRDLKEQVEWVSCKAKADLFNTSYPAECNASTNPKRRGLGDFVVTNLGVPLFGVWMFISFAAKKEIYQQWYILLVCVKNREFGRAWRRIKFGFTDNPPIILQESSSITSSGSVGPGGLENSGSTPSQRSPFPSVFPTSSTTSSNERETRATFLSMASTAAADEALVDIVALSGSPYSKESTMSEQRDETNSEDMSEQSI